MRAIKHIKLDVYIDYTVYLLLFFYLIVDLFAGYMIITGGSSGETQLFKFLFYALIILSITAKNHKYLCFILALFTLMFFAAINVHLEQYANMVDTMSFFFRLIITPILFFYFKLLFQKNRNHTGILYQKIFIVNIFVFTINFILGLMGYGFASYITGFGVKGFFHSAHLAAGVLFCFHYYILLKMNKAKLRYKIAIYVLVLFIVFSMGTKTAILSIFLFSIIDLYKTIDNKWKSIFKLVFPFMILTISVILIQIISNTVFFYHLYATILRNFRYDNTLGNIINILLSGRLTQVYNWAGFYYDNFNIRILLFGLGYLVRIHGHEPMEIDFFFVFFFYGIILLFIILFFYVYLLVLSYKKRNMRLFSFNLLYLVMSFTTGYVWMNVMAGVFYAYINAYETKSFYVSKNKNF